MEAPTLVSFVALGCAKNLVDSEKMLGQLAEAGCVITSDDAEADVVVVNTCGFLEASRTEADDVIQQLVAQRDATGRPGRIVVAGCLVQRDREKLLDRLPGIDALVGVNNRDDVVRAVLGTSAEVTRRGPTDLYLSDYHSFVQLDTARLRLTPRHYAYLRISEGCNQKCTFCTIPAIRGPMHCKPPPVVLAEARELIADGAVELHLIGQDTTSYGLGDDSVGGGLGGLLRSLDRLDGVRWIRLMYAYPTELTDDIIEAVGTCLRVCNYIDLPLQHINDRVLKAMHRRIDRAGTEGLLRRIRDRIPGVTLRTTMIVGFPGETEAEFSELEHFVRDFGFDALGVFAYSLEPETPAGRMREQVPDAVKRERVERLMLAQQEVAFARADARIDSSFEVLVDERAEDGAVIARHEGQAPTVDSVTRVDACTADPGSFVTVRCVGRADYDLTAVPTRTPLTVLAS
jgi:ribosomal protein S12 methylthiotransferase